MDDQLITTAIVALFNGVIIYFQWRVTIWIVDWWSPTLDHYKMAAVLNIVISLSVFLLSIWALFTWLIAVSVFILHITTIIWQILLYVDKFRDANEQHKIKDEVAKIAHLRGNNAS